MPGEPEKGEWTRDESEAELKAGEIAWRLVKDKSVARL